MTDTEQTPVLARSKRGEEPLCCWPSLARNHKCAKLFPLFFSSSFIMFIVALIMYCLSEESSELLCPDRTTSKVKSWSLVAMTYVFVLCLFSGVFRRPKSCFDGQNKNPRGLYFVMLVPFSLFVIFLPLLISSLWLNFYGMNMIIWNSTDGAVYRCELGPCDSHAHLILFPSTNDSSNNPDQICEFWPVTSLCDSSFSPFHHLLQSVMINDSRGAYRCQESSPEGHDLCLSFLKSTWTYSLIQAICAFISAILLNISLVCIKIRKPRKKRSHRLHRK